MSKISVYPPGTPTSGDKFVFARSGANYNADFSDLGGGGSNSIVDGRLTLLSGTPVPTTDQTAKTTVYFTPHIGNKIALYDGSAWVVDVFTELSVAVPNVATTPFDIFCYDNAGTPTLETANWTNGTTRATALTRQNGVLVKSGATTRRYLGTGRTTSAAGQCEVSAGGTTTQVGGKLFLWNYYNRVRYQLKLIDTTDTWVYTNSNWRMANGSITNMVEFVIGYSEDMVQAQILATAALQNNTVGAYVGIGQDTIISPSGFRQLGYNGGASLLISPLSAAHEFLPAVGYHFLPWLESGANNTCAFYGDGGATFLQTGLFASLFA